MYKNKNLKRQKKKKTQTKLVGLPSETLLLGVRVQPGVCPQVRNPHCLCILHEYRVFFVCFVGFFVFLVFFLFVCLFLTVGWVGDNCDQWPSGDCQVYGEGSTQSVSL